MYRANQEAFVQSTNNDIVELRSAELSYFCDLFQSFGTQCALIAGFVTNALVQIPVASSNRAEELKMLYYFSATISLICAIHVMLCTGFMIVYGQGMAIRGPLGSLARAIAVFDDEVRHIFYSYCASICFFAIGMIGVFFVVMDLPSAIAASILNVFGMYLWRKYCTRIYRRFFYVQSHKQWFGLGDDGGKKTTRESNLSNTHQDFFTRVFTNDSFALPRLSTTIGPDNRGNCQVVYEGYVSIKLTARASWKRCFVVINDKRIYYYADKHTYERTPEKMLRKRPIDLDGYKLLFDQEDTGKSERSSIGDTGSTLNVLLTSLMHKEQSGNIDNLYIIHLDVLDANDDRSPVFLKCDSMNEYVAWLQMIEKALRLPPKVMN